MKVLTEMSTLNVSICYIIVAVVNSLLLRMLALEGVSSSVTVGFRGLTSLLLCLLYSRVYSETLIPKQPKIQAIRLLSAALGLSLCVSSYKFISGSTVHILSRMDLLILIILGSCAGMLHSRRFKIVAGFALFAILKIALSDPSGSARLGVVLAATGTAFTVVGYLFLRRSVQNETVPVVIGIPSLGCLILGVLWTLMEWNITFLTFPLFLVLLLTGPAMFSLYLFSRQLYQRLPVLGAELPSILISVFLIPLEMTIFGTEFPTSYLFTTFGFLIFIPAIGLRIGEHHAIPAKTV